MLFIKKITWKHTFLKISKKCLFLLLVLLLLHETPLLIAGELELTMQDISLTTQDNVIVAGSWIVPQVEEHSKKRRPAVILLHDYGFNRRDWGIFIPDLIQQGYNVLAIDLRGHGQSKGGKNPSTPSVEYLMDVGHLDIAAAVQWLRAQKNTDKKAITLVGVGIGADLAYFSSGKYRKQIKASVVISPSYAAVIDGDFIGTKAQTILFCVSAKSQQGTSMLAAETLSNFTEDPKKLVIYNSSAHGFALFYKHPEIKQEILGWLSQ